LEAALTTLAAREDGFYTTWNDAYLAFRGAFDTPADHMRHANDYTDDARARMRQFNEMMQDFAPKAPTAGEGKP
jgi:hypothetical protein